MSTLDPWAALAAAKATLANSSSEDNLAAREITPNPSKGYGHFSSSSNSSRGASAALANSSSAAKERKKSSIYIYQQLSCPEPSGDVGELDGSALGEPGTPARVAILREFEPSHSDTSVIRTTEPARVNSPDPYVSGPYDHLRGPQVWRDGCSALSALRVPCPGIRPDEWSRIVRTMQSFIEQHAVTAHDLGWSTLDLFAVHPVMGATRVDACGALMVSAGATIQRVEADAIAFRHTTFRRCKPHHGAVPVWQFQSQEPAT